MDDLRITYSFSQKMLKQTSNVKWNIKYLTQKNILTL